MRVAAYHGLEFGVTEYEVAEDPGSYDDATLYVTHMREPVKRSISHFKCECTLTYISCSCYLFVATHRSVLFL